jgi:hypothetical protein
VKPERPLALIAARCVIFGGVVFLVAVPIYVYVEPPWRALVGRLAAAVVLAVTLLQLHRALADLLAPGRTSALDEARDRRPPEPSIPYHFLDLTNTVRAALRSRQHFDKALWPRLAALARRPLVRPAARIGRGPSLASLRGVITTIEQQQP